LGSLRVDWGRHTAYPVLFKHKRSSLA
jgi:hypothetical protein